REALAQAVQPLGHLFTGAEREILRARIHLDPRQDALLREVIREQHALGGLLARRLVEQDDTGNELLDAGRGEKQPAVGAAAFFGAGGVDGLEARLAGAARFVRREHALALRDHGGRGSCQESFIHRKQNFTPASKPVTRAFSPPAPRSPPAARAGAARARPPGRRSSCRRWRTRRAR